VQRLLTKMIEQAIPMQGLHRSMQGLQTFMQPLQTRSVFLLVIVEF